MLKVGLTGGMGAGKSTVAQIFEVLGIPVYYADDKAKKLMIENEELKASIINSFGAESYINGNLNREYIAGLVFNNDAKIQLLNSLVHPVTLKDAEGWTAHQKTPYTIKEAALIFESGSHKQLDLVIGVRAPEEMRIQRIIDRDHISVQQAKDRMSRQMDEEEKMRLCDYVIVNDERQMVLPQVILLHEKLLVMVNERGQ
ncbi:MAG: dephospho-CoA kinase [Bacteroidota bacterium]|nr:dephospho-CoA kinase [Bacteroidota bacterium]